MPGLKRVGVMPREREQAVNEEVLDLNLSSAMNLGSGFSQALALTSSYFIGKHLYTEIKMLAYLIKWL